MKVIWKYPLENEISMPIGAQILRVGYQSGYSYLWAMHSVREDLLGVEEEVRRFKVIATGEKFDGHFYENMLQISDKYIGTYEEDSLVWHVFEIRN